MRGYALELNTSCRTCTVVIDPYSLRAEVLLLPALPSSNFN
jgi:hypothetical protein